LISRGISPIRASSPISLLLLLHRPRPPPAAVNASFRDLVSSAQTRGDARLTERKRFTEIASEILPAEARSRHARQWRGARVFARRAPATRNGIPGFLEEAGRPPSGGKRRARSPFLADLAPGNRRTISQERGIISRFTEQAETPRRWRGRRGSFSLSLSFDSSWSSAIISRVLSFLLRSAWRPDKHFCLPAYCSPPFPSPPPRPATFGLLCVLRFPNIRPLAYDYARRNKPVEKSRRKARAKRDVRKRHNAIRSLMSTPGGERERERERERREEGGDR